VLEVERVILKILSENGHEIGLIPWKSEENIIQIFYKKLECD